MAYHLVMYKTIVNSTVTVREQLELLVELFDYEKKLKIFHILIDLLSYLKICSIFSQMLFNTVTELKNPAPLCLHCSSVGL